MKPLAAIFLAAVPALLAQPTRFGLPACQGPASELADREFFVLCHDSSLRVASWTAHEILPGHAGGNARRPRRFRADAALTGPVAHDADYRGSGWTRGHLVTAEDMAWSNESIRATFVLSNAAPQLASVNRGSWRRIENAVRSMAAESDAVYVFTGPVLSSVLVEYAGRVAIPTHFFKVWLALRGNQKRMYAAIVPNAEVCAESVNEFAVAVDEVERRTGLDFFAGLDDEEELVLESKTEQLPSPRRRGTCAATIAKSCRSIENGLRHHDDYRTATQPGGDCTSSAVEPA